MILKGLLAAILVQDVIILVQNAALLVQTAAILKHNATVLMQNAATCSLTRNLSHPIGRVYIVISEKSNDDLRRFASRSQHDVGPHRDALRRTRRAEIASVVVRRGAKGAPSDAARRKRVRRRQERASGPVVPRGPRAYAGPQYHIGPQDYVGPQHDV